VAGFDFESFGEDGKTVDAVVRTLKSLARRSSSFRGAARAASGNRVEDGRRSARHPDPQLLRNRCRDPLGLVQHKLPDLEAKIARVLQDLGYT
jgi:hypothetical protein